MRNYYRNYVYRLGSAGSASVPFTLMTAVGIVSIAYLWVQIVYVGKGLKYIVSDPETFMLSCLLIVAISFMLLYITTAVKTYRSQRRHVRMLQFELVRLNTLAFAANKKKVDDQRNNDANDKLPCDENGAIIVESKHFLKECIDFLEKYDDPPTIAGVPTVPALLYGIYSYIGLTIISEIVTSSL